MKKPRSPESYESIELRLLQQNPLRFAKVLQESRAVTPAGPYLHWDQVIRRTPPADLDHAEWWLALKLYRTALYRELPFAGRNGGAFRFLITDAIAECLHELDLHAGGSIGFAEGINPRLKNRFIAASLMEEAWNSSVLEGAATTRQAAKEMLLTDRPPKDRDERMVLNNFLTMRQIVERRQETLTPRLVFDLHRLVTEGALDDPTGAGRFRTAEEEIIVQDMTGEVFHIPPAAAELPQRLDALCRFANAETPGYFLHPVVRAIILHFWLAYDHPFIDGNGRTARALFYWAMLHYGYWMAEFLSISAIIRRSRRKYYDSFLFTETDDGDVTYFLHHQTGVLREAMQEVRHYLSERTLPETVATATGETLNFRQQALLAHALQHHKARYTIEGHRINHGVVYQTARTDLLNLLERGLLRMEKQGKAFVFSPQPDLQKRLKDQ